MTESPEVRRLAREIVSIKRALANMERSPQMGFVSLDDASLNTYDQAGGLKAVYGRQHDGTFTAAVLDGPPPPVPAGLSAEGGPGEVVVSWDGTYEDDKRAPMDFHIVEVWAAENDFTDRSEARLLGHYANESGGEVTAALPVGTWHVALVSKAQSGRRSAVSERVVVEVESVVDQAIIDELNDKLADMPSITWDSAEPTPADGDGKPEGAVWRRVTDGAIVGEWEWTGAAWEARPIADDAIHSVDVSKITAAYGEFAEAVIARLWVDFFAARKVAAEEIDVQDLWADAGFIGELNSATIIGAFIATAASGMRVELDNTHMLQIFNADQERVFHADDVGNLVLGGSISLAGAMRARLTKPGSVSEVEVSPAGISLASDQPAIVQNARALPMTTGAFLDRNPTFGVGDFYFADGSTSLYRGTPPYPVATMPEPIRALAARQSELFVCTGSGSVTVLDSAQTQVGAFTISGTVAAMAATPTDLYVLKSGSTSVFRINPATGAQLGSRTISGIPLSVTAHADGRVYVGYVSGGEPRVQELSRTLVLGTVWNPDPENEVTSPNDVKVAATDTGFAVAVRGRITSADTDETLMTFWTTSGVQTGDMAFSTVYGPVGAFVPGVGQHRGSGARTQIAASFATSMSGISVPDGLEERVTLDTATGRLSAVSPSFQGHTTMEDLDVARLVGDVEIGEISTPNPINWAHVPEQLPINLPDARNGTMAWTGGGGWGPLESWVMHDDTWAPFLAARALSTENLNDVTMPGTYVQTSASSATAARNYPEAQRGTLTVVSTGASNSLIEQTYTTIGTTSTPGNVWTRTRNTVTSGWSPWALIGGDSGWRNLTLAPGITQPSHGFFPAVRRLNGVNYLRGRVQGFTPNAQSTVATLPVGYRPPEATSWAGTGTGFANTTLARVEILANTGEIVVGADRPAGGTTTWVDLAGFYFM